MTTFTACAGRSWRLLALPVVAAAVALAPVANAGPEACGPTVEPAQAETLSVRIAPVRGLRLGQATPVEVEVRRDGAEPTGTTLLEGAHVSMRIRSGRITSYVDGSVDAAGRAVLGVTLDSRAMAGPADVLADVWMDAAPHHGCHQLVREHGYAQTSTRVSR